MYRQNPVELIKKEFPFCFHQRRAETEDLKADRKPDELTAIPVQPLPEDYSDF